jgi:adenylate kinase family enzyme
MDRLVKDYDIAFVSTGDVLRKEIMAKSEVGKRAEEVVANGGRYLTLSYQIAPDE